MASATSPLTTTTYWTQDQTSTFSVQYKGKSLPNDFTKLYQVHYSCRPDMEKMNKDLLSNPRGFLKMISNASEPAHCYGELKTFVEAELAELDAASAAAAPAAAE